MIFWSSFGFIVPILMFGTLVVTQLATTQLTGDPAYYTVNGLPKLVAFLLAALVLQAWTIFRFQAFEGLTERLSDGREVPAGPADSFMFIPLRFWPYISVALGCLFFVV